MPSVHKFAHLTAQQVVASCYWLVNIQTSQLQLLNAGMHANVDHYLGQPALDVCTQFSCCSQRDRLFGNTSRNMVDVPNTCATCLTRSVQAPV